MPKSYPCMLATFVMAWILAAQLFAAGPATQPDGSLLLPASSGRLLGVRLHLEAGPEPAIVHWTDQRESVEWPKSAPHGTFEVEITYACAVGAGGEYTVNAGADHLRAKVEPTGDWQTFKTIKLGKLSVLNDQTTISIRAIYIERALLSLRSIRLIPIASPDEAEKP